MWSFKANSLVIFLAIASFVRVADSIVSIPSLYTATVGSSLTIYCNLSDELVNAFSWVRYNGSISSTLNLGNIVNVNTPSRYSISVINKNSTNLLYSTLTIKNVTSDDFTVFECLASSSSKTNITLLIITTTTVAPITCLLDNYNYALYIMIILSNIALAIAIIATYQFISDPTNFQLLLLFGVLLGSVILVIVMILFWISPNFVSGDSQVWSPVVIIPCGYGSLFLLWLINIVFLVMVFKSENIIEIPILVIELVIFVIKIGLIIAIFFGIAYCTNTTSLNRYTSDPQLINVVLGGTILFLSLIVLLLMLWKHKGKKKIISIQSAAYNNVRDHSFLSGFFGVRSAPSENLSPTSVQNSKDNDKSSKTQLPLLPVPNSKLDKEKQKDKTDKDKNNKINEKELEKPKEKSKKDDEKKKDIEKKKDDEKKNSLKLPDLQSAAKSPESSFGSMDFDQNDLRRSTPNAEEIESAPKTTNPLLMNFIKNSNEQNLKNLEAIREETPDGNKNKNTPKTTPKVTQKVPKNESKDESKEVKDTKDSSRKEKKEKNSKKKEKKSDEAILKDQDDNDSLNDDKDTNEENLFSIEPISDRKDEEGEKKKSKKAGKGKTKSKE